MLRLPVACAYLVKLMNEIKLYHWTTGIYSRHVTSDKLYSKLQPSVDKFIEMFLIALADPSSALSLSNVNSNNSRSQIQNVSMTEATSAAIATDRSTVFNIDTPTDSNYPELLRNAIQALSSGFIAKAISKSVALTARRDVIVEELQTALYLSRLG